MDEQFGVARPSVSKVCTAPARKGASHAHRIRRRLREDLRPYLIYPTYRLASSYPLHWLYDEAASSTGFGSA